MLFHSSVRQELARSFGATLVVLVTVVMTMTLIRTLGQASRGSFNPSDVMLVMGYTVLAYMPTILTMSLFIAIFGTLSRMYRDSEMVIWFGSGKGLAALLKPLFRFAWPVLLVVMALALLVLPWSNNKIEVLKEQYERRGDMDRVEPGQFQESAGGTRVFFVEKNAGGKESGANVFIATTEFGKETVTSARSGQVQRVEQDRFLMLSKGQRLENEVGKTELKISEFEEYGTRIGTDPLSTSDFVPVNTRTTHELLKDLSLQNLGELSWRLGLFLAAINFVIIGTAVSSVNPRVGRSANLVFSLFAFVLYNNLLNLGQNWIASGQFTFGGYMLGLHGSVFLLSAFWVAKGHNGCDLAQLGRFGKLAPTKESALRTIRRLIYGEVVSGVGFVTLCFLCLFFFFDFVEEIQSIGRHGAKQYRLVHALGYVTLMIPSHLYELLPIAVLIGTIFVMARLAKSSEYTILRTSGLGPWRALKTLLILGLAYVFLTFAIGDYLAPMADHSAQLLKARYQGRITVGHTGAWLKERQAYSQFAVNVAALDSDDSMRGVRIFEFDNQGYLMSMLQAESAVHVDDDSWTLKHVLRTEFPPHDVDAAHIERAQMETFRWPNQISAEMVSAALLKPERMSTIDLFQYIRHLDANGQSAQRYQIEFWKKVFYPLSCLVMVVLALPFAYLHFRTGGITGYVFGGVMAGISFFLLNNVFGYIGNMQNWQPWLTAALPGLIYSLLSLTAFGWLVFRR